jgi:hypothetical protein
LLSYKIDFNGKEYAPFFSIMICPTLESMLIYFPKIFLPNIMAKRNSTIKMKNRTFAIEAAPAAIPVNPKIAAMIAITKNITAYLSIK